MIEANSGLFNTVRLHHEDPGGPGRPVVLLHGWPLSAQSWSPQVSALREAGFRAITYDRRGFGRSDKPRGGYDYDTLAEDLEGVINGLDLHDVTLVGFSMGGGEVARYIADVGEERLHSVVFASAVTPYMMQTSDNPDGPLTKEVAAEMEAGLTKDEDAFYDQFLTEYFSVGGELKATEAQRQEAVMMAGQASKRAALKAMAAFGSTDFRDDLAKITVPTLVIHGDGDETVPFEGSGARTHAAVPHSELVVVPGAPHGLNVTHTEAFNRALLDFVGR